MLTYLPHKESKRKRNIPRYIYGGYIFGNGLERPRFRKIAILAGRGEAITSPPPSIEEEKDSRIERDRILKV
jgi:hypothetical protein